MLADIQSPTSQEETIPFQPGFIYGSTTASTGTGSESTTRQRQCDVTKWKKVDASMSSALNWTEELTGVICDRRVEFMTEDK